MAKRKKPDWAHQETDRLIEQLEQVLSGAYAEAEEEINRKLAQYLKAFEAKDEKWRLWVLQGERTEDEYRAWRTGQIMMQQRWENLRDEIARDLVHADEIAQAIINGEMPEIYALNHGWETYTIEKQLGMTTGYTLYNADAVRELLKEDPLLLPQRKVDKLVDHRWNMRRVQSVMLQGVLQGQSIPELARSIQPVMDGNWKNAIRNARTMSTGAQNAGRLDALKRAESKGAKLKQTWLATLDMRTRHEHRELDGQTVAVGETFKVAGAELRYPGDPAAPGFLVYNCRCRLQGQVIGFEHDFQNFDLRNDPDVEGMTYEQWKASKVEKPRPITHQADTQKKMHDYYYSRYAKK